MNKNLIFEEAIVIGYTDEGIIVCDIRNTDYFSVCFNMYEVYNATEIMEDEDLALERIEENLKLGIEYHTSSYMENCGVSIRKIARIMYRHMAYDDIIKLIKPNTEIGYEVIFDDDDYQLELISCGQHDTRNAEGLIKINEELYDYIHELWDEYQLRKIPTDKLNKLVYMLENTQEANDTLECHMLKYLKRINDTRDIAI